MSDENTPLLDNESRSTSPAGTDDELSKPHWQFLNLDMKNADHQRVIVESLGQLYAVGVSIMAVSAVGTELDYIASNVGVSYVPSLNPLMLARGCGGLVGIALVAFLPGTRKVQAAVFLAVLAGLTLYVPFITSYIVLYVINGLMGLCDFIVTQVAISGLRAVHQGKSGPWMAVLDFFYVIFPIIVPVVQLITSDLVAEFVIFACIVVSSLLYTAIAPEMPDGIGDPYYKQEEEHDPPHYWVEAICLYIVAGLVAVANVQTVFLETYIVETEVISSSYAPVIVILRFVALLLGDILALYIQYYHAKRVDALMWYFAASLVTAMVPSILVIALPRTEWVLWLGVGMLNFTISPAFVFILDLQSKLTFATKWSALFSTIGIIILGTSLFPWTAVVLWSVFDFPLMAFVFPLFVCVTSLALLPIIPNASYIEQPQPSGYCNTCYRNKWL